MKTAAIERTCRSPARSTGSLAATVAADRLIAAGVSRLKSDAKTGREAIRLAAAIVREVTASLFSSSDEWLAE